MPMMANTPKSYRPAPACSSTYTTPRQMPTPAAAALACTFVAPCGGGHGGWPRNLGGGDFRGCAARPAAGGGVGAAVSAVWAWIAAGRSKKKVAMAMSRSGSSRQYGHEEYAQNFDDGGAAGEPENLARSFSVRYARQAPSDNGARRRG